ncbi:MAG TPA: glutamine synthetase family protein [Solirubrobacteraceae bacterium]|nr:glutamine synthetase family protein [Solirubrobacteraceae bacterium]
MRTQSAAGTAPDPPLTLKELERDVQAGAIDTVVLALVDMQGRLQGKRLGARHFVEDVAAHGAEGCCYLLAVDVDMNTVDGYEMASWRTGYGDFEMHADLSTLRRIPWHPGTALCLADLRWADGRPVAPSPRQILRRQLQRLSERGWEAHAATELEFIVFRDSYEEAWRRGYRDLTPVNLYNVDYSMLGTARIEPLMRRIRNEMTGAGMVVESSKGECNRGQHEVNFRYAPALHAADNHAIYKDGAKAIAAQEGLSITYMPKFDEREGNSCHIHLSIRATDGTPVLAEDERLFESFVAGQLAHLRELTLLYAPTINAYKRYARGSFAPTAIAWGKDNRTCAIRVVGHGAGLRLENRVPGGDVNPYLALAAMIAAGLDGIDAGLSLEPPLEGSAYEAADRPRLPTTLREARDLFRSSRLAREAFGEEVVEHYLNMAQVELDAFDAAVTDWERYRGFERL